MAIIQIPVLFDMSGDTLVFGEEVSGDFLSSHLDFLLDMTTEANDISLLGNKYLKGISKHRDNATESWVKENISSYYIKDYLILKM